MVNAVGYDGSGSAPHMNGGAHRAVNGSANGYTNGTTNGHTNGVKPQTNSANGSSPNQADVPIAIVGMSCRFPGDATSPEKLWKLCVNAKSAWSEIPADRWNKEAFHHPDGGRTGTTNVRGGHFLQQDIALFDAPFFNVSAEEAKAMDPQLRLQLEICYEAIENAGIPLEKIAGTKTAVFSGIFTRDYTEGMLRDVETLPRYYVTGTGTAMLANRVSYFFDLKGPSLTVDTGCSTSLVALHLACQSIRSGESEAALVGGSNIILNPDLLITLSNMGFLSPEGKSYAFDHRAAGYGRGEGAACIVIKPLDAALRDGDHIHSIIRQTAVNSDGKTDGITQPSAVAHERLIRYAYNEVNLDPLETDYIEAHGTGTQAGDPLELKAVGNVFGSTRNSEKPIYVGSVKTNVGHLEAASGLAGIIKASLALKKGIIPPNINFEKANEKIPLELYNMQIPLEQIPWPSTGGPRRASVNSLGYGGTNAHVILESPSSLVPYTNGHTNGTVNGHSNGVNGRNSDKWRVFTFSGKDEQAVYDMIVNTNSYLESRKELIDEAFLDNLAYTLGQRRSAFRWVQAFPANSVDNLQKSLGSKSPISTRRMEAPRIGFVFTGQGAQWYAMGRELISAYPVFKQTMHQIDEFLKTQGCPSLLIEELNRDAESTQVNSAIIGQPLCTAIQIALVNLLAAWNIKPSAVTGHSSGEIASAYAAGALSLESAMLAAYHRGAIAQNSAKLTGLKGSMIAVGLSREKASEYIQRLTTGKVVVACVNSPTNVTVSGDLDAIDELQTLLDADGVFGRKLKVTTAYHSHHMVLAMDGYQEQLHDMKTADHLSDVLCISSVTGEPIQSAEELGPSYWVQNAIQPVLFSDALTSLCRGGMAESVKDVKQYVDILIEVGPHGALASPVRQTLQAQSLKHMSITYLTCLTRNQDARESMQLLASSLLLKGAHVDLGAVNSPHGSRTHKVLPDLPSYPWSHKTRYWHEPRINRQQRQRLHGRHDLLGIRTPGQNDAAPTWRHFLRISDQPWVKDHVVDSNILYPAAGFIAMAVEAISQMHTDLAEDTAGYRLHEMKLVNALVVPETSEGVEVQLSLFPSTEEIPKCSRSYNFRILSVGDNDEWHEHCTGHIGLQTKSVLSEGNWKQNSRSPSLAGEFSSSEKACTQTLDTQKYYDSVQKVGISYGESFQNLVQISQGPLRSLAVVKVRDTAALMPCQIEYPHIVHPTTLDAIFQSIYPALAENGLEHKSIMIPTFIRSLFISHNIDSTPGSLLKISTVAEGKTSKGAKASLSIVHENDPALEPAIEIKEIVLSSVGTSVEELKDESGDLCFKVCFDKDISFMSSNDFASLSNTVVDHREMKIAADLQRACFHIVERALKQITNADRANFVDHHLAMYNWMTTQHELGQLGRLDYQTSAWLDSSDEEQDKLIADVESESVNGEMCVRVGRYLVQILRKQIEPLQVMMEDRLLYKYYENALGMKRIYSHLSDILRLYSHKNPGANILEIGGGTGGCTIPALQALTGVDDGIPRFAHYTFTDISSGFFEKAREKLAPWEDRLDFKKFNAEVGIAAQDVEANKYDLVIACNVLHATANMDKTMSNVRQLLRPGGKILIVEGTRDTLDISLVFGVLPGWWLGQEEERSLSPKLPINAWDSLLKRTGFTGQEALMLDAASESDHVYSVFLAGTGRAIAQKYFPATTIVLGKQSVPEDWLSHLSTSIETITGLRPDIAHLDKADVSGKVCILLAELNDPILAELSQDEFYALRKMLISAKGVIWVTKGGTMESSNPEAAMVTGLMRTMRIENAGTRYVTLDLDPAHNTLTIPMADTISGIFQETFDSDLESTNFDLEYSERDGQMYIPRVVPDPVANAALLNKGNNPTIENQNFYQEDRPLLLGLGTTGLLDTMRFEDDLGYHEPLPEDFVEVAPKAFGLNFRDVMIAMGQLNETIMGYECAGVITRVGSKVTRLKVGDRVAAMMRGNYANYIRLLGISVSKIPDDMPWEQATSMPMVFCTAYFSLYDTARLQKGETILIHAAAGGVGQAAIMLAQLVGAEIYATVGSKEKAQLLMDAYGIPEDHIFTSRNASFATDVMAATNGKGVDVALNSLSGQLLDATWKCMAMFGRLVEIGKRDIEINTRLNMSGFQGNVSFSAIDLTYMGRFRPAHLTSILEKCMQLASEGKIHAVQPVTVYPISDIERAFRFMQAGKHSGKVVIKPNEGDIVKVVARQRQNLFRPDSSYIIVGGLGGLGRSLSQWMAEHGARNLIILSRSGESHPSAGKLYADLEEAGCRVIMPACDIKDRARVHETIISAEKTMPPVRGLIQGAMVLNDCVFEHMSFEQYQNAVFPKVQGAWNLHTALSKHDLDFFVMLSSAVGIVGNSSQANYAAGSSFLDALANHRLTQGLPALSLDLGIINSVGYVAENEDVAKRLARMGHDSISEEKMLGLIELAIADGRENKQPSHIVTGLSVRELDANWIQDAKFSILRQTRRAGAALGRTGDAQKASLHDLLSGVKSLDDATTCICEAIVSKLANNLMVSDADIDPEQPITACGVDSLVAVELRNWLLGQTGAEISVVNVLQSKSLVELSATVAKKSKVVAKSLVAN